jgi:hypothetical protein
MQRSKKQALTFLLGALLVGAILGFSADRVFRDSALTRGRQAMYDDLRLTDAQRTAMDSLLDQRHCQIARTLATVEPKLDSIRASARAQMNLLLTPDQQTRLEARRAKWRTEKERREAQKDAKTAEACK